MRFTFWRGGVVLSFRSLKRWWQIKTGKVETPLDSDVPFWALSLVFHLLILILLARMIMPTEEDRTVNLMVDDPVQEIELVELPPDVEFDDMMSEEVGADGDEAAEAAAAEAPLIEIVSEDDIDLEMPVHDLGELMTDDDMLEATGETMSSLAVKGSVGHSVKAASGAVDRLTQEILNSLQERNTTVVWLFDQSASLLQQRSEIQGRFDKVYEELGVVEAAGHEAFRHKDEKPLLTQVYAFGSKVTPMMRKPTDSLTLIKETVGKIQRDETGNEYVMSAVIRAVKDNASVRKIRNATGGPERNLFVIVVSDEAGDDLQRTDEAIQLCTKLGVPIYVVGVPAPFGRPETKVKWVDPDPKYDQQPQWAVVSQGPESVRAERLQLDFTGTFEDLDMIDSGFGPFHLTRLSYETGGMYFAVHPNRRQNRRVTRWQTSAYSAHLRYFFDPAVMRRYKPDYVSQRTYNQRLESNAARRALVHAAAYTTTGSLESPILRFPKLDDAAFVNLVSRAQRSAAFIQPKVDKLYEMLRAGEADREKELSLRWKAGYDLAMGRTIAAKVRAKSYNGTLALVKTKLKFDPPKNDKTPQNNTWLLRPADTVETGSRDAKLLAKAKTYLDRVIEEHPNTPWAMLAQREIATPLGWKWEQGYTEPPRPAQPRTGNARPNNNVPQPRQNAMPKQKRPPPKL